MDLIDRTKVERITYQDPSYSDPINVLTEVRDKVRALPTVDAEPVRHGKYIGTEFDGYADGCPVYYEWKCSECGCVFEEEEPTYNYCPNCGAKMDGADHE